MSSPAPFHSLPSERRVGSSSSSAPVAEAGSSYELYNLGTELRQAAIQVKDYGYLVLRLPTEESWAFAQSGGPGAEAPPPYPLWIPRREAVVSLARTLGLEVQCVAEDTVAFHNWTSRFFPSLTVTLAPTRADSNSDETPWFDALAHYLGNLLTAVRNAVSQRSRTCFVFQKIPGAMRKA